MNKSRLKSYGPAARRDFIRAVTERANLLGLSKKAIEPVEEKGDVVIIAQHTICLSPYCYNKKTLEN